MKNEFRLNLGTVELRAAGEGEAKIGTLEGYAARYNARSVDLGGFTEVIAPGAFNRALGDDADVFAYADHDSGKRIGRTKNGTLRMFDEPEGLRVEIDLPNTTTGRDMAEEVRTGLVQGMSFGFRTISDTWKEEEGGAILRTLNEVELFEVSAVGNPAYPDTSIAKRSLEAFQASATAAVGLSAQEIRQKAHQRLRLARA
jgi:uncharacterized protein